ncbi:MAG: phosphate ABC transporter permease PstA, partial [Actinomycetota bacterium]
MAGLVHQSHASEAVARSLRGKRFDAGSFLFQSLLLLGLLISLALLVTLLAQVAAGGFGVLVDQGLEFLRKPISTLPHLAGVSQGLIGSALLIVFVVLIAFPLGIGAAIYLEEYATDTRLSRFIDLNIRNLAGVPSIVYGILGLAVLVEAMAGVTGGRSIIAGGVTLALLVLPIVIITTAEAIRAVPLSVREAGYGVGATRWDVTRRLVLPSAAPGILTGTVLSLSRALGET